MRGRAFSWLLVLLSAASAPAGAREPDAGAAATRPDFGPVTAFIDSFVGPAPEDPLPGASLIVIRDGKTLYRRDFGTYVGIAPQAPMASASKWLSALVIQRLVEQGRMHWDDTVADAFGSDYPNPDPVKGAITLAELMSHTSGMSVVDHNCLSYPRRNMALVDCAKAILGTPLAWEPGTVFAYGANSMQVAGAMAQRTTGLSWARLVADELTGPLRMTRTSYGINPGGMPFGNPIISGGARSTLRDYANVVQMVVQGGVFDGAPYLSPGSIAEMQLDQTHGLPVDADSDPYPDAHGYGYGEWRHQVDCNGIATRISSTGAFGTSPWVDYDHGIAAVFLAYKQDLPPGVSTDLTEVWDLVADALGGPAGCKG